MSRSQRRLDLWSTCTRDTISLRLEGCFFVYIRIYMYIRRIHDRIFSSIQEVVRISPHPHALTGQYPSLYWVWAAPVGWPYWRIELGAAYSHSTPCVCSTCVNLCSLCWMKFWIYQWIYSAKIYSYVKIYSLWVCLSVCECVWVCEKERCDG